MGRKNKPSKSDGHRHSNSKGPGPKPQPTKQSTLKITALSMVLVLISVAVLGHKKMHSFQKLANWMGSVSHTASSVSLTSSEEGACLSSSSLSSLGRSLRPSDLPEPIVFTSFEKNTTVTLPNGMQQAISLGKVAQTNNVGDNQSDVLSDFAVLPQAVDRSSIDKVLKLLRGYQDWDDDPDTVDGMTSHEMFLWSPDLYDNPQSLKYRDVDSKFSPTRKELRTKLSNILRPYLDNIITPMVHQRYPSACTSKGHDRYCTPCFSLIRKYKHGQRQSHATHHDGHAIVTVVVSLSDYNINYRGGLYVSTGMGQHEHVALNKGDAVMHQSSLLHGVKVYDLLKYPKETERWSWIMWYRDSEKCDDYGHEWFADCAEAGNPICQHLDSTKVDNRPGISQQEVSAQVLELNMKAADGGSGISAVKIARAYMHQLPSALPFDIQKAAMYYNQAIQSNNPDGHYGLALILLFEIKNEYQGGSKEGEAHKDTRLGQAIRHLEQAAFAGHAFAMFNLGIVHTYGYRNGTIDVDLAGEWYEESGLPEGYLVAANAAASLGKSSREQEMMKRAQNMGAFAPWRAQARQNTGSGGAGGVSLNMPWPPAFDGRTPPTF